MADETIRIKELPEIYELPNGMMVPVDSNSVGTRKIDLKNAIEQYGGGGGGGGDGKMDKDNPVGTGTFSMNRMPGDPEDVGEYSATLNNLNIAKGEASTAEGYRTVAGGVYSHTEGVATMTTPVGGESTQMAIAAHAEGSGGIAGGDYSHVEGGSTLANNITEHAEGNYNKSNYNSNNWGDPLNTLHSVGCGTGGTEGGPEQERKNAHEIMQNGDHYVMGIGGYDGTNPGEADTLQNVINAMLADQQKFRLFHVTYLGNNQWEYPDISGIIAAYNEGYIPILERSLSAGYSLYFTCSGKGSAGVPGGENSFDFVNNSTIIRAHKYTFDTEWVWEVFSTNYATEAYVDSKIGDVESLLAAL